MAANLKLGTRGSALALIQSQLVGARLRAAGVEVEVMPIVTEGDLRPADTTPGEGIFVAALARALLNGEIDLAVHSAKDVPLDEEPGLVISAYPERADARDVLVTASGGQSLESLPRGATVGTDSPRRTGFVRALRPDLIVVALHGNVDTRLRRLDAGEVAALVLAGAGLIRLGRAGRIDQWLDAEDVPPAPGQGALAVQTRARDVSTVSVIDDKSVRTAVTAERSVLRATGGGCRAPVGALAAVGGGGTIHLVAGAVDPDGGRARLVRRSGRDAEWLGDSVGRELR